MSAPAESPTTRAARDLLAAHIPAEYGDRAVELLADAGLLVDPEWAEDIRRQCAAEHRAEVAELRQRLEDRTVERDAARQTVAEQQQEMAAARPAGRGGTA